MDEVEYRSVIKLYVLLKKSSDETFRDMAIAYGKKCPSRSTIHRWISLFKHGHESVHQDYSNVGRPTEISDQKITQCEAIIRAEKRIKVGEIAELLKISVGSCHNIIGKLDYRKLCSRFVPKFLSPDMKEMRLNSTLSNLQLLNQYGDAFINSIVTEDETPLSLYLPETKQESSEWRHVEEKPPLKMRSGTSHRKQLMLSVFWDKSGVIHLDFLPNGQTINGQYYAKLVEECRRKKRKSRNVPLWLLVDNAPVHASNVAQCSTEKSGFTLLQHPPYSPDLAPSDFFLFKHLKKTLRGHHFETSDALQQFVEQWFAQLPGHFFC